MKRLVLTTLIVMFALGPQAQVGAGAQQSGVIAGTVTGANGAPLAGATVNIVNSSGTIIGSAVTGATGGFSLSGFVPGTYAINVLSATGAVISTGSAMLAAGAMTATVSLSASAAAAAGAAAGASAMAAGGLLVALYVLSDFGAVSLLRFDSLTRVIYTSYRSSFDRTPAAVLGLVLAYVGLDLLVAFAARFTAQ